MLLKIDLTYCISRNNVSINHNKLDHSEGESMKIDFDGGIKVEFHGAKVTSDGGFLAYHDLDDALGLFDTV